ncbi:glycerophosphodiester phosphodiesterase [Paenibacillus sp. F411]|uniref:Glycerophosphoryl diester phosphodiesterase n=1 Tax=Paenibacillus algicola TaxID=2565926 RepID=A0A4P8XMF2_9BACL|nr:MULTISPECIES: glycerophosphodiester phosphodiesterase family protein [Paenibacillus]MBO2942557.1 glycerophosphodiester phosphodiesterase [Paenibacillus sp. F411]QCT03505.1 glycerophosphoryl diester phosphodiesterase [Paenibacillus algicola]
MNNFCVAHRGFSGKAPENTRAAFKLAMSVPYVKWLEIDVQLTRDGVPVVIHDFSVDRTTTGKGKVKDLTWREIRTMDAGIWKGSQFEGEQVPSLDEVLQMVKGRLKVNIELKTSGDMYPGLEEKVLERVRAHQMLSEVVITSFEPKALLRAKELEPEVKVGLIIDAHPRDLLSRLKKLGCSFLSIGYSHLDASFASELLKNGITPMAWTVDDRRSMAALARMNPEIMICTNRPDMWGQLFSNGFAPRIPFWDKWKGWFR